MANPIKRGFSKLTQFSGRDTRGEFWPYAGVAFVLIMVVHMTLSGWILAQSFAGASEVTFTDEVMVIDSSGVAVETQTPPPPSEIASPLPDARVLSGVMSLTAGLALILLSAAVSRRLHDRNMRAYWGLMPVPFLVTALTLFPVMFTNLMNSSAPNLGLFGLLFLNNIAYLIALVTLIIFLAQPSWPHANQHGEPKTRTNIRPVEDWSRPS